MTSPSLAAAKRLRKELQSLQKDQSDTDNIVLRHDPDNLMAWTAFLKGPADTPFQDGVFHLKIEIPQDYPLCPPKMKFLTKVFHPNVHFRTGEICLDILKKEWSPAWGLASACRAVLALLSDPDAEYPLNCDAGNMIRENDRLAYESTARMFCIEHATYYHWPPQRQSEAQEISK